MSVPQQDIRNLPLGIAPTGPIKELYIFVASDSAGNDFICSYVHPGLGVVMMVTGALEGVEQMRPIAQQMMRGTGVTIKIVKFLPDATIEELLES
jgi:hypothetical protein